MPPKVKSEVFGSNPALANFPPHIIYNLFSHFPLWFATIDSNTIIPWHNNKCMRHSGDWKCNISQSQL